MIARGGEAVVDEVRERCFEIEYRVAFIHHLQDGVCNFLLFFFGQEKVSRVGVGRVEIERDCPYVFRVLRDLANVTHGILVDLIDGHVETDVVRCGVLDVFHDGVERVASDGVVAFPVAVKAQENQVRFGQVNRLRSVRDHVDNHEAHSLGLDDQIPDGQIAVSPQERLAAAEEENAGAHVVQCLHLFFDLYVGMHYRGDVVDGTVLAFQVAAVGYDDGAENRIFLFK